MGLKMSDGLNDYLLDGGSMASALDGHIEVYQGIEPESANDPPNGTLLIRFSDGGDGTTPLGYEGVVNGKLVKASDETWSGTVLASGKPTYYRHVHTASDPIEDHTASTSQRRLQGLVGRGGGQLNMTDLDLTAGDVKTLAYYAISFVT